MILLQVFLSRVDQRLHGETILNPENTSKAIADIESQMVVFPFAASGAPVHARWASNLAGSMLTPQLLLNFCLPADGRAFAGISLV